MNIEGIREKLNLDRNLKVIVRGNFLVVRKRWLYILWHDAYRFLIDGDQILSL